MKLYFLAALVVITAVGIDAAVLPDTQDIESKNEKRAWCDALECKVLDIIVDGLKKLKQGKREETEKRAWCDGKYCELIDNAVVALLDEIIDKYQDLLKDAKKTVDEKVEEIWEQVKESLKPIIHLVGDVKKIKEVLKEYLTIIIDVVDSPSGISRRSLVGDMLKEDLIMDAGKTLDDKVEEIWDKAKEALKPIIHLVGNVEKTKEILRKYLAKVIAFDSPGGISGRSLAGDIMNEGASNVFNKPDWGCETLDCKVTNIIVHGLGMLGKLGKLGKREETTIEERSVYCDDLACDIIELAEAALKPILLAFKDLILDASKTINEKVQEIWEHAKLALQPIIRLVGSPEKTKEILKKFVAKAVAFDSPGGLSGL